eukprot:9467624-Pyramimonas_sp.AAC.1
MPGGPTTTEEGGEGGGGGGTSFYPPPKLRGGASLKALCGYRAGEYKKCQVKIQIFEHQTNLWKNTTEL